MIQRFEKALTKLAIESEGTAGKYKLAAGVIYKKKMIAVGVNSYKSHPIMMNKGYRYEQMSLHAEADALVRASKLLTLKQLASSVLYVVRVKRGPCKDWVCGLAKPCEGCMALINEFGIKEVEYTTDGE